LITQEFVRKENFIIPFENVSQLHESALKFEGAHLKLMWSFYINLEGVNFLKLISMLFDLFQAIQLLYEIFVWYFSLLCVLSEIVDHITKKFVK